LNAAEILIWFARRGYRMSLTKDGSRLSVEPALDDPKMIERVLAKKADIISFLKELGAPAATAHAFVALPEVSLDPERASRACCIGCVWELHGQPPTSSWQLLSDPGSVALIQAAAIVASATAEGVAGAAR
jgi:hypothetical protein